ncbi:MAG: hypothetical protein EPO09_10485 [Aquabacterium sp.]|uniref:hypothetical protein n=1 Tax=Aquabacterium sp. TaxID=1872578 RepID=UPI00120B3D0E|nr:hypothetical protein [Aquabacterium sp.]TAK94121.1 MAG: hypothetical protein EPO09_10485 [Aquabacterium sp.]
MNRTLISTMRMLCLSLVLSGANAVMAQGKPIDDEALSDVWGQALFSLTNTSENGYDFSRITLNADIKLNANLGGIRLGEYTSSVRNGTGADIDIAKLQLGRSDGTLAQRTVSVTDPYVEFVYRNVANSATREVVGMRLGFGGIQGDIGLQMNAVSGSLLIDAGANGTIDSRNDTLGGKRWDGTTCTNTASCLVALSQVGGVTAGNASGASRDFFISVLKSAVTFPTNAATGVPTDQAMAGFWLNWRDRLTALNVRGAVPANVAGK